MTVDVVIVGGGLGGLYAAHRLLDHGLNVRLLEAKDRLGGRIFCRPSATPGLAIDLGPTWFWPHQVRINGLLDELGVSRFEQYIQGEGIYELNEQECSRAGRFMGMQAGRAQGGMQNVVHALSDRIGPGLIELSSPVDSIERSSRHWEITSKDRSLTVNAHYLILALPPRIIARDFHQAPWLSPRIRQELQRTPTWMAAQAKFVATYESAFWRKHDLAGDAFSQVGPMIEMHDASAARNDGFALFGFVGGAAQFRGEPVDTDLESLCLAQLERIFGPEGRRAKQHYLVDWAQDPDISTQADANQSPEHPQMNLVPFAGELNSLRLGFAASEAASEEPGYLEGAIQSAQQAVADCIAVLR